MATYTLNNGSNRNIDFWFPGPKLYPNTLVNIPARGIMSLGLITGAQETMLVAQLALYGIGTSPVFTGPSGVTSLSHHGVSYSSV